MTLNVKLRKEIKLASAEFINKSMTLLSMPSISDDTFFRVYSLLDKLHKGYVTEKTFQTDSEAHQTLETILSKDRGIDPNVTKLFMVLFESYTNFCAQLIADHKIENDFNKGLQIDSVRNEFAKKFSAFLSQIAFTGVKKLFPPASLKTVLSALEETQANLADRKEVDTASIFIILSYLERKSKEPGIKQAVRDLKQSMNHVLLSEEKAQTSHVAHHESTLFGKGPRLTDLKPEPISPITPKKPG